MPAARTDPEQAGEHGFADTSPLDLALARDVARLFGPLGVEMLRAAMVDTASMTCRQAWHITRDGQTLLDPADTGPDSTFPAAMATIVHLNQGPFEQTLARKLDPRRWAFGWRLDERHVAVAEARYHQPRSQHSEVDKATLRLLCDTCIRGTQPQSDAPIIEALPGTKRAAPPANARRARSWRPLPRRALTLALALGLALAASLFAVRQHDLTEREATAQRQALADATMVRLVATTLADGDYGEVQAELNQFAALNYFRGAVVTNARRRIVAIAGEVHDVRIGDPVARSVADGARKLDLAGKVTPVGQLLVWNAAPAPSRNGEIVNAALVLSLAVAGAAALLLVLRLRAAPPRQS